jgi:hypothetical protein
MDAEKDKKDEWREAWREVRARINGVSVRKLEKGLERNR